MKYRMTPRQLFVVLGWAMQTGQLKDNPIKLNSDSVKLYSKYISMLQTESKRRNSN